MICIISLMRKDQLSSKATDDVEALYNSHRHHQDDTQEWNLADPPRFSESSTIPILA